MMATTLRSLFLCRRVHVRYILSSFSPFGIRTLSTKSSNLEETISPNKLSDDGPVKSVSPGEKALAGFAKALEKAQLRQQEENNEIAVDAVNAEKSDESTTFATLLRSSKLMQLGEISGRMIVGTIFEVNGDDLYIDLGGKFHCVCPLPKLNPERYRHGVKVKLQLNDLEMSSSFLGSEKHVTLLEADATLIGLRRQPQNS